MNAAFFWNHRASWAAMLTGISTGFGMLDMLSPNTVKILAFAFSTLAVVLNTFPDMTKEP